MKKILLLSTTLFVATAVLAFGGGGKHGHRVPSISGVDAIGVYIDGEGGVDTTICTNDEELWDNQCLPKCSKGLERNTDGSCTICTNGKTYVSYMNNPCEYNCARNEDCTQPNQYCALKGKGTSTCGHVNGGICANLTSGTPAYIEGLGEVLRSDQFLSSWWDADQWCKAWEKQLVTLEDIGCSQNGNKILVEDKDKYDSIMNSLKQKLPLNSGAWTGSWADDPCYAYYISTINSSVGKGSTYSALRALCK